MRVDFLVHVSLMFLLILARYSTGFGVTGGSALIHEFYSREVPNPVHLTVDTGFKNGEGSIKAFITANLSLGDRQLAAQFQEIPLDLRMVEAEQVGCMYLYCSCYFWLYTLADPPSALCVCVRACIE